MIGTYINLSLPSGSDTMADVVAKTATCLGQLRDSIADKAAPAALNLNANVDYLGNRVVNCGGVTLVDGNNPTAAGSFYYHSGEFYAIDATGTIKLTLNGQLNLASVGGIGGDYGGSNPALVSFDTATGQYRFYTNGGGHLYGDVVAKRFLVNDATSTNSVIVQASNGLAAGYTMTLPPAVPSGAIKGLTMDTSGAMGFLDANIRTLSIPAAMAAPENNSGVDDIYIINNAAAGSKWVLQGNTTYGIVYPVSLPVGAIITGWTLYVYKQSAAGNAINAQMLKNVYGTMTTYPAQSLASANPGNTTMGETGLTRTTAAGEQYVVYVNGGSASAIDLAYQLEVNYKFYL